MKRILTSLAAAALVAVFAAPASALTAEEEAAIAQLEAQNIAYEALLDDLDPNVRADRKLFKETERKIAQNDRLIARIEAGRVKDPVKAVENNPGSVSPT